MQRRRLAAPETFCWTWVQTHLPEWFTALAYEGNTGGRFDFPQAVCDAINSKLRQPLGPVRPAFPVPGGGVDPKRASYWIERYGVDTILLVGGSLYAQGDLVAASRRLVEAIRRHAR